MPKNLKNKAGVIWITGLSGSGKTTLAKKLVEQYRRHGYLPIHLDGDDLRLIFETTHRYDLASRLSLAKMYSRLANLLARQGHLVIVSTISMFHEVHANNRQNEFYCEVYIESDVGTLKKRNIRHIYENPEGTEKNCVVGNDIEPEIPISPHLKISIDFDNPLNPDINQLFIFTSGFMSTNKL